MPLHNDNHRLNPRRDDQERKHDGDVPPEGVLYLGFEEGIVPPPHPPDGHHAEP